VVIGVIILMRKIRVKRGANDGRNRVVGIYIEYNVIVIVIMVIERMIRRERERAKRTMYRIIRVGVRVLLNTRGN